MAKHDRCAIIERAGKAVGPGSGPYEICLSPKQAGVLFGERARKLLGCGAWACAWTRGEDQIVKITRDKEDVAGLVKGQGLTHVVKVKNVFRLRSAGKDARTGKTIPIYAVVAERLEPIPATMKRWTVGTLCPVKISLRIDVSRSKTPRKEFTVSPFTRQKLEKACSREEDSTSCERFGNELLDTFQALYRRGVDWQDIHDENILQTRAGHWKVVDLGLSDARMVKEPPTLNRPTLFGKLR